jgi:hypothetical protein
MYALCTGFVGTEAAIAYSEFVAKYERVISAEDVLGGKISDERVKELQASEALGVIDKIVHWTESNDLKKKQAKNVCAFIEARGGEQMIYFWNALSKTQKLPNISAIHQIIGKKVVDIIRSARNLSNS